MSGTVDLDTVVAEIYDEVARRRASGDLPATLEAELDAEFANYAPAAVIGGDLGGVLHQADKLVHLDVDPPTAGRFPAGPVKRVVKKLTFWYMQHVANQVSSFGSAVVRALRMLDRRLTRLEEAVPSAHKGVQAVVDDFEPLPVDKSVRAAVVQRLRGCTGRVLHTECGAGQLVQELVAAGVDAYGADRRRGALAAGLRGGLDLRPESALDHTAALAAGALAGLVLTGAVDTLATGSLVQLADQAARALGPGGLLLLVGTAPEAWGERVPVVIADLSPGRPLHAETWAHLLTARGFDTEVALRTDASFLVVATKA